MIECAWCGKEYKTTRGYHAHVKAKHPEPDTSSEEEDRMLGTVTPEPTPKGEDKGIVEENVHTPDGELRASTSAPPETPGSEAPTDDGPVEEDTPKGEVPIREEGSEEDARFVSSPGSEASSTDDEMIASILSDPIGGPLMQMIQHLNTEQTTFKQDVIGALKDVNDSVEYLKNVPKGEPDIMAGFDSFVEKYGLGDTIKETLRSIPDILNRISGGDPVQSELGSDFMAKAKDAYLREQNDNTVIRQKMMAALSRGDTILTVSPEDLEKAKKAGFLDE